ncbi:MAG: DsrE family protein [Acidimicrobiia bacterium]|nr:DsrE family protein [Acidimicrobiia bacterium]
MAELSPLTSLDMRGKTITTFILYEAHEELHGIEIGDRIEVVTDAFPAIDSDLAAWCRTTGHRLVDVVADGETRRYVIEKGEPHRSGQKLAAVISDDGLFELLSPLGFALAAALGGHDVALYFQGPAVRVLAERYTAKMHGPGRPFSRFPRSALAAAGHLPPQEKIAQLQHLGAQIYVCGPSMEHYKVDPDDLAFDDVTISEYPTFMEQMASADIHLFV